jgi:hypothetical protein
MPGTHVDCAMTLSPATEVRIQVLELRIRIERLGAAVFDRVCEPAEGGRQNRTRDRLLFLLGGCPIEDWQATYRATRLGAWVYRRTSDVLHGRVGGLNIPQVVLDEWRVVVDGLEEQALHQYVNASSSAMEKSATIDNLRGDAAGESSQPDGTVAG